MIHLQKRHRARLLIALIVAGLLLFIVLIRLLALHPTSGEQERDAPARQEVSENTKCDVYRKRLVNAVASQNFSNKKAELQATFSVPELFYSPKTDSCLYVEMMTLFKNTMIDAISYQLKEVDTDDVLYKDFIEWGDNFEVQKARFSQVLETYKK